MQVFFDKFLPEEYHEVGHIFVEGCTEEYGNFVEYNFGFNLLMLLIIPESLIIAQDFKKRYKTFSAPLMSDEDELCVAYGDFIRCVQSVIAEVMKFEMLKHYKVEDNNV